MTLVAVSSANLKIQKMTVTAEQRRTRSEQSVRVVTEIVVHNHEDDNAQQIRLIVTLPPTAGVVETSPTAELGPAFPDPDLPVSPRGYVTFLLDELGVNMTVTAKVVIDMSPRYSVGNCTIGAFVYGTVPDPDGSNNCASAVVLLPPTRPRPIQP